MRIKVHGITGDGRPIRFVEPAESFPVLYDMVKTGECKFLSPIKIQGTIFPVRDLFDVEGSIEFDVNLSCSRCLKAYKTMLRDRFNLTYTPDAEESQENADSSEIELDAEEIGLIAFDGDTIDLREAIQEQVVMALSQRPLCGESCKGLCAQCGADLNEMDCGCGESGFNSKFAALKDLKLGNK